MYKKIQNLIGNFFKNIFNIKIEIKDTFLFRKEINQFHINKDRLENLLFITGIVIYENKEKIFVEIETHKPGSLIGVHGTNIEGLAIWLTKKFNKEVTINIKECKLFNFVVERKRPVLKKRNINCHINNNINN